MNNTRIKEKIMNKRILTYLSTLIILMSGCSVKQQKENNKVPMGVEFQKKTLKRVGTDGDNWCITWAKDNSQITSMCDGIWMKLDYPDEGYFHNHLYRLIGEADNFQREDIPNYPVLSGEQGSWFGYGIISVDGNIYSTISKTPKDGWSGPFTGFKLLKSSDNGKSWYRINRSGEESLLNNRMDSMRNVVNEAEMFFLEEYGLPHHKQVAWPFTFVSFVQNGQNNSAARDGYIYIYSPEGAHSHNLNLARVKKEKIGIRNEWQYFTNYTDDNQPLWTNNIANRGTVYTYPEKSSKGHYFGWYSWLPSVVWNEGLGLYIMVNGGTYAGKGMTSSDEDYYYSWMHNKSGSLGFWYSENPYGPWKQFYYTDHWTVDDVNNRTYQPKLSPKWISEDGKEMTLIWSDQTNISEGQTHNVKNYLWNQMKIHINLK